jgi:hypothetical protein
MSDQSINQTENTPPPQSPADVMQGSAKAKGSALKYGIVALIVVVAIAAIFVALNPGSGAGVPSKTTPSSSTSTTAKTVVASSPYLNKSAVSSIIGNLTFYSTYNRSTSNSTVQLPGGVLTFTPGEIYSAFPQEVGNVTGMWISAGEHNQSLSAVEAVVMDAKNPQRLYSLLLHSPKSFLGINSSQIKTGSIGPFNYTYYSSGSSIFLIGVGNSYVTIATAESGYLKIGTQSNVTALATALSNIV